MTIVIHIREVSPKRPVGFWHFRWSRRGDGFDLAAPEHAVVTVNPLPHASRADELSTLATHIYFVHGRPLCVSFSLMASGMCHVG